MEISEIFPKFKDGDLVEGDAVYFESYADDGCIIASGIGIVECAFVNSDCFRVSLYEVLEYNKFIDTNYHNVFVGGEKFPYDTVIPLGYMLEGYETDTSYSFKVYY